MKHISKRTVGLGIVLACLTLVVSMGSFAADDRPNRSTEIPAVSEDGNTQNTAFVQAEKKRKKARGRLPNYYGKAGSTKDNRSLNLQ
jgi:hypothetical protein